MATSIGAAAHFCCILLALEKKLSSRRYNAPLHIERIAGTLLRTVTACALMGVAGLVANHAAIDFLADDKLGDAMRLLWVGLISGVVFAIAAQLFAIPEWDWLKSKITRRSNKPQ